MGGNVGVGADGAGALCPCVLLAFLDQSILEQQRGAGMEMGSQKISITLLPLMVHGAKSFLLKSKRVPCIYEIML